MLKINKILSKKIKSPLSLPGLFPFCHSRESGNPSFLSLRGVKQQSNLNHNGFSLIELMIAITILAMAIFGIFHAYSVGFLGMADARDRTVATNYAREAMEDVKNMDFELVTNENLGTAESVGEKFTRVISVNTENGNLKEITTLVYWNNRNGKTINIETSMYINRTLFNPREAAKIVLYASPYYAVLPSAGVANIIAVIKDLNGNTKIDWTGGNIHFSILGSGYSDEPKNGIGSHLGNLGPGADGIYVTPNEGRAETIFTASGYEILVDGVLQLVQGDVVIKASVILLDGSTVSDTITIAVTLDVVRIELSADPTSIEANGTSISTVTAALKNSGDVTVTNATNDITFNISGEGIFVDSGGSPLGSTTVLMAPSEGTGEATIYVKSITDTPGVATVTASSEGLLSDTVNIITTGDATSISVFVVPDLIYTDNTDGATVTLEIQDNNGNPVEYNGNITLSTSPEDTGKFYINGSYLNPYTFIFNSISPPSITYSSTTTGLITIIAIGDGSISGNTDIDVREALIADTITIKADPKNIFAGGDADSKITATIKQGSTVISNYNNDVTFEIVSDTSSLHDAELSFNGDTYDGIFLTVSVDNVDNYANGEVVIYLKPASYVGICTIKVSTVNSLGTLIDNTIEVGFYSTEDHIELSADPSKMLVDGYTCEVTAKVVDENGNTIISYDGDVTFTILVGWPKIAKFALTGTRSLTKTLVGGEITVDLISQSKAGTVTLKASSFTGMTDIIGYLNIAVDITLINLVKDTPAYSLTEDENRVTFNIDVQGAEVILGEMQVSWSDNIASEILNKIDIGGNEVYSNADGVASGTVVVIIPTDNLPTGISTIEIFFNSDMSEKELIIIFNPNSEYYYPVGFSIPAPLP